MDTGFLSFRRFKRRHTASISMEEDQVTSRFVNVLMRGFERELKLPIDFCHSVKEEKIPYHAILISRKGMWAVDIAIAKCNTGRLMSLLGDGWDSFIAHHHLKLGDVIQFQETDHMVFKTLVFDGDNGNGCEKQFSQSPPAEPNTRSHKANRFAVVIRKNHVRANSYLTIPSKFLEENDLSEKETAILINAFGEAWEVEVASYFDSRFEENKHMVLRKGWRAFFESNQLGENDSCTFEIDYSSTLTTSKSIAVRVKVT